MKIPIRTTPTSNGALSYESPTEALKVALAFEEAEPDNDTGDFYELLYGGRRGDWRIAAYDRKTGLLWEM